MGMCDILSGNDVLLILLHNRGHKFDSCNLSFWGYLAHNGHKRIHNYHLAHGAPSSLNWGSEGLIEYKSWTTSELCYLHSFCLLIVWCFFLLIFSMFKDEQRLLWEGRDKTLRFIEVTM